jgi:hypothetical protein
MRDAEVAQQVEQRTENPRVASPILALGTSKRKWCSGSMPPCQGGGREFESRLPLHCLFRPKWRNRQTRWSQKPLGGNPHVGSIPTFGSVG